MSHNFLLNASFHLFLNTIDKEIAATVQQKGCAYCGNKLHQANYPRSPLGVSAKFRESYNERLSFCCDQCRKRTTPQSVRFFGRRWFPAPLFIFISVLLVGINERRLAQIRHHFGIVISESTWKRWHRWWRESFMATSFWQQAKGMLALPIEASRCPRALLSLFRGKLEEKVRLLLQFLAPLTSGILRAV